MILFSNRHCASAKWTGVPTIIRDWFDLSLFTGGIIKISLSHSAVAALISPYLQGTVKTSSYTPKPLNVIRCSWLDLALLSGNIKASS
jgi:hypothetical protein